MHINMNEAEKILNYLQKLEDEINALWEAGSPENKGSADPEELRNRLASLKESIKADAKSVERICKQAEPDALTPAFLEPALRQASAGFTMRANTAPFTEKWSAGLSEVHLEISYHRDSLNRFIEKNAN